MRSLAWLVVAVIVTATPARTEQPSEADDSKWTFTVAPYLFLPAIEGELTANDNTVKLDISPGDVLDLVGDGASLLGMLGHVEAHRNRLFLATDVLYGRLDTDEDARIPIANRNIRAGLDVKVRMDMVVAEFFGGYRVVRMPHRGRERPLTVDLFLGTRYYYVWQQVKTNIAVAIDTPIGSRTKRVSPRATASPEWADPMIGARWSVPILDRLNLEFRGDIGGFELASDLAWSLVGVFSYDLPWSVGRANPSLMLGYKALSFDYENGNNGLALTLHGLVSGVRFYF